MWPVELSNVIMFLYEHSVSSFWSLNRIGTVFFCTVDSVTYDRFRPCMTAIGEVAEADSKRIGGLSSTPTPWESRIYGGKTEKSQSITINTDEL